MVWPVLAVDWEENLSKLAVCQHDKANTTSDGQVQQSNGTEENLLKDHILFYFDQQDF